MLKLLRKYQKSIFAVVTVMVIGSFLFFGTYGAIESGPQREEDIVIGKLLDGAKLSSKDVAQLCRFLDSDVHDAMNGNSGANLISDGFLRNDILKNGLGLLIYDVYKDELCDEITRKISKFKEFKPYVHPSKFTSFEMMIQQFAPNYYEDYIEFRLSGGERDGFEALAKLYVDQSIFPAEMMKRMMLYVEYQYAKMAAADPGLRNADLSLFYAKSSIDWFGQKFLEKVAHFVLNGAAFAAKQGYKVSFDEAKSSLLQIATKHIKEIEPNKVVTNDELNHFYKRELSKLNIDENDALKIWSKVLVFRKMLDDVGNNVFVDSIFYKQFSEYASQGAKVELFRLPKPLRVKKPEDAMKVQLYLEGVSKNKGSDLVQIEFSAPKDVQKIRPELVEKRFLVKIASVKKSELATAVGVRKTWDWQLLDQNWKILQSAFPEIAGHGEAGSEARFAKLESLNESVREKIDQFSRTKIVEEEPDLIRSRLGNLTLQQKLLSISLQGESEVLPGINDRKAFLEVLEKGDSALSLYTQNGEIFYRIEIVDGSSLWELLSFEEANKRGVLDQILSEKGVKEKLENQANAFNDKLHRYMNHMYEKVKAYAEGGPSEEKVGEWDLQREEVTVTRKMAHPLFNEKVFEVHEGDWSDVVMSAEGPIFYYVLETFVDTSDVGAKMEEGRALLGREAKEDLVKVLLQKMIKNGS